MYRNIFFCLLTFVLFDAHAQNNLNKGYYINNTNDTVQGYFKNIRTDNSPLKFHYSVNAKREGFKLIEGSTAKKVIFENGEEYDWVTLELPLTNSLKGKKENNSEVKFIKKSAFVTCILKGTQALLYRYKDNDNEIFIVKRGHENDFMPLVSKTYIDSNTGNLLVNKEFKKQLSKSFTCGDVSWLQEVEYNYKSLQNYFKHYNKCMSDDDEVIGKKETYWRNRDFSVKAQLGVNHYSYNANLSNNEVSFESELSSSFGIELELELPIEKDNFSIFLSIMRSTYIASGTINSENTLTGEKIKLKAAGIDYRQIIFTLGPRYYFFPDKKLNFFINCGVVLDNNFKKDLNIISGFSDEPASVKKSIVGASFGGGLSLNKRYYLNLNYFLEGDIINEDNENSLKRLSMTFGVKLF